ncbi:MAG TPA: enoyl-ACP reductase [bacterium]|jgi:enoyl-[acyl-carrier protein] reductase I|nr:enoyl-ACP reductase [bacterium]
MGLLSGKKALIFGVANDRSIAWGIAQALHREGAELGFTFLGEALEKRVRPLAASVGSKLVVPCDATKDEEIAAVYAEVAKVWGKFDILIHAMAYARKEDLEGAFMDTSRDGFLLAMNVSAFSLLAVTKPAVPLMNVGGSVLTLTYYGSDRVMPNYNVMGVAKAALESSVRYLAADLGPLGIRVNAISAGAIKTLASSGIAGIRAKIKLSEQASPMRRNVTQDEVGNSALYLCSDLGSGVTGEIHFVDNGVNIMGEVKAKEEPAA